MEKEKAAQGVRTTRSGNQKTVRQDVSQRQDTRTTVTVASVTPSPSSPAYQATPETSASALVAVPQELKDRPQWVVYRTRPKPKAPDMYDKVPFDPVVKLCDEEDCKDCRKPGASGKNHAASVSDSNTWSSFEEAVNAYRRGGFAGVGFVFTIDDPFVGIDLDKCRNAETGNNEGWANEIVADLDTYTEVSPSGKGLHLIAKGVIPENGHRRGQVEMYQDRRFFTMSGVVLPGYEDVRDCNGTLTALHRQVFGEPQPRTATREPSRAAGTSSLPDDELLDRARRAKDGDLFHALFDQGDLTAPKQGDGSQNSADLSLCNLLRFWTGGDVEQMDRLFRCSALMRDKWDKRRGNSTYGQWTIARALTGEGGVYSPGGRADASHPQMDLVSKDIESVADCRDTVATLRAQIDQLEAIAASQRAVIAAKDEVIAQQHRALTGVIAVLEADMKPEAKVVQMGLAFRQHKGFGSKPITVDEETGEIDEYATLTTYYVHQPTEAQRLHVSTDTIQTVMKPATSEGVAFIREAASRTSDPWTGDPLDQPHTYVAYVPVQAMLGDTLHAVAAVVPEALTRKPRCTRPKAPEPVEQPPPPPAPVCDVHPGAELHHHGERADVARCSTCSRPTQTVLLRDGTVLRPGSTDDHSPTTATNGRGSPSLIPVVNGSTTTATSGRGERGDESRNRNGDDEGLPAHDRYGRVWVQAMNGDGGAS